MQGSAVDAVACCHVVMLAPLSSTSRTTSRAAQPSNSPTSMTRSSIARLSSSDDSARLKVVDLVGPREAEPLSPRSHVERWDTGAGARARRSYRTFTPEHDRCMCPRQDSNLRHQV